jgi:hypothetical protein
LKIERFLSLKQINHFFNSLTHLFKDLVKCTGPVTNGPDVDLEVVIGRRGRDAVRMPAVTQRNG